MLPRGEYAPIIVGITGLFSQLFVQSLQKHNTGFKSSYYHYW